MKANTKPNFFARNLGIRNLKLLICLLSLFIAYSGVFADTTSFAKIDTTIFNTLYSIPKAQRIIAAETAYKKYWRKMPPNVAMHLLDKLDYAADFLKDRDLQCDILRLRADYYSVNDGFNPQSIAYHQKAIEFARAQGLLIDAAVSTHFLGMYYYTFKKYNEAYPFLLDAQDMFHEIGQDKIPGIAAYLNDLGMFYYSIGDYYSAKSLLEEALKHPSNSRRSTISIINSIGLIYRRYKQFPQAVVCLNTALKLAIASRDSAWIGIATGNIGSVYFMQGNYEKAYPAIRVDYDASLKYKENVNAAIAMLRIAEISLFNKKNMLASQQLDTIQTLIKNQADVLDQWITYHRLKAVVAERTGNLQASLTYRKEFELEKDSLANINNVSAFERMRLRYVMDAHKNQFNKLKTELAVGVIRRNAIVTGLFLLVVIFGLIYNSRLLKEKKDRQLLNADKMRMDERLKNSMSELRAYTENLREKNELIEDFKTQIENLKATGKTDPGTLHSMIPGNIMTESSWEEFKKLFVKVHVGFFFDLKKRFPHLSNTDTRLLALIKMQMSNREMANMLGVTVEGIKKAKQRLKKKMGLSADETIESFVGTV